MLKAGLHALVLIMEQTRLLVVIGGVVVGLALGVIPGSGGVVGLAILFLSWITSMPVRPLRYSWGWRR